MGKTQIHGNQIDADDITNAEIADNTVRGTTANISGTVQEIAQGTISTPDLRDGAVDAAKILSTDDYTVNSVAAKYLYITVVTSDPVSPTEGQCWYNSTVHQLKLYNGTSVVLLG